MKIVLGTPASDVRIEDAFLAQAAATPAAPAVIFRGDSISYAGLADWVESLAGDLVGLGAGPGVIVALCLSRTPAMIALMLATLRSGAAYLPLDERHPAERNAFMLADSAASILIADSASPAWADFRGIRLRPTDDGKLTRQAGDAAPAAAGPADLAYVIYTSGSTGSPKGVMLGHGATHLVDWARQAFSAQARSRVVAATALSFDPSIFEIFTPLSTGGAVVLKENALEPFGPDEQPTMFGTVPSVLKALCRAGAIPPSIEVLNVGGEVLPPELVREVYRQRPNLTIYNHYGPTEATTVVTMARIPRDLAGEPPLGTPVRAAEVVLLSPEGEATPDGEVGEICLGGPGLALGYLNRPDLTAERFPTIGGRRLYRTGDLGQWRDGQLYFAGRTDRQLKLRGHRIEPGEIEAALERHPDVARALVVLREGPAGPQLVAYLESPAPLEAAALRVSLSASLPAYMVPAHILVLPAFPQLVSGKLDTAALPDPFGAGPSMAAEPASRAERPILHVFEEVLGRTALGPNDSFFEMGGDSLASVQAALRLEEVLGRDVPAGLLHQAPTARRLAAALEHGQAGAGAHLSLLQPGGGGPPLFCLADLFGQPFNYLSLARELGPDRAIYGLAPGPLQAAFTADGDVARLTEAFRAELLGVRPHGPYLIAGYSAGGLLAADLAAALEREGREVRLVLLDSALHSARPSVAAIARWVIGQGAALLRPAKGNGGLAPAGRLSRLAALLRHTPRAFGSGRPPEWIPRPQLAFAGRMIKVGASYRPAPFSGPTLMVRAREREPIDGLFDTDGMSGWSGVIVGPCRHVQAPGGHHAFMRGPLVAETAEAVRGFMDEAGAA